MITTCFEKAQRKCLEKRKFLIAAFLVSAFYAQPISADSNIEDKNPNLCFAEISKLKSELTLA